MKPRTKKIIAIAIIGIIIFGVIFFGGHLFKGNVSGNARINRSFKDLTLGMSLEEFKSKLIYEEGSMTKGTSYRSYAIYNTFYNSLYHYSGQGKRMKEIKNVYSVWCYFLENKLFKIHISYLNSYHPTWDNVIHNAKGKYGEGIIEAGNVIRWDDGKTTLTIAKLYGEQGLNISDSYSGDHYTVTYKDNELSSLIDKKEKKETPEI
ncbi:MAG: hypothetical protein WCI77_07720 [Candidatus Omnitrophota bacterium]